jgi:6-phosphogluconate dehydrogenase
MIHNGVEYGLMQAYAEGFALMKGHPDFDLDLEAIAGTWLQGSVVRSWLLELTKDFLGDAAALESTAPVVADSGEGRWTAQEAIDRGIPAPVISAALMQRFASQGRDDFAARVLALMRNRFGGHAIPKEKP